LADPNNFQTEKRRGVSLLAVARYKRNWHTSGSLKRRQRSDMNRIQSSHGHASLNDLFGPAQNRPTQLDQLPSCSFTLNPAQRDSEVLVGQLAVAFSSA
jgi:hypothetical protein